MHVETQAEDSSNHTMQAMHKHIPMTDPCMLYIWCAMDPIKINPSHVSIYIYTSTMDPSWDTLKEFLKELCMRQSKHR